MADSRQRRHPYQAVIFDRDGVLADVDYQAAAAFFAPLLPISLDRLAAFWQAFGEANGFPANMEEEAHFWRDFWHHLQDELSLSDEVTAQLRQLDYTRFFRPFPDARPAMLAARQRGLSIGVLSNFSLASLEPSLAAIGVDDLVDVAAAATVIGAAKPAPAAYLSVTEALGVSPEACLFFDDEMQCVHGARALNLEAYHVDRGRAEAELEGGVVVDLSVLTALLDVA